MRGQRRAAACAAVIGLAWVAPGRAADPLAGLLACRDLTDPTARLACFDREAAALSSAPRLSGAAAPVATTPARAPLAARTVAAPPAAPVPAAPVPPLSAAAAPIAATPAVAASAPAAPVLSPEQQFGLPERKVVEKEVAAGTRAADASKIEAHLVRIAVGADGRAVFTLDNDQVWRQLQPEGDLLAKSGDAVTISRGLLGSYWLQLPSKRGCKVNRDH
ncbi:MAG: hypothetical protein ACLQAR_13065 [Steroidobacteraceae bacterium]